LEAHAEDTWPIGSTICYNQTHTIEDRAKVARDFIRDNKYEFTIRIDDAPSNAFNDTFAAWPLRFYLIEPNGKVAYIHEPEGPFVMIKTFHKWLIDYFSQ